MSLHCDRQSAISRSSTQFIPALRIVRIVLVIKSLQSVRMIRGLQLLRVMARVNKGMRILAASTMQRGFGYVVGSTAIVTLIGAAGIYAFERELPNGTIVDCGFELPLHLAISFYIEDFTSYKIVAVLD
jgi:hypothetical protein